jgi:hypothetical protein
MKYLRRIEWKIRKDRKRNTTVRGSLKIGSVVEDIGKINLEWYVHLIRMNNVRKTKQVYETWPEGRKDGKHRKRNGNNI